MAETMMSVAAGKSAPSALFRGPELTNATTFASKTEEMCGDVVLEGPDKVKRYVHLKVYRTSLEHFAVVYPLKRLSKPMGIINIRNTCITPIAPATPPPTPRPSAPFSRCDGVGAATAGGATANAAAAAYSQASLPAGFTINQRMFDVNTSVTLLCDAQALPAWANAFTSRSSPTLIHQTSLPCVQEEDAD